MKVTFSYPVELINRTYPKTRSNQQGFTLIELMIALMIFAMLALAGWQIMDSITKSRDRGYLHQKSLSQLDYAYLQLSQDLAQTTNYVAMPNLSTTASNMSNISKMGNNLAITPTFVLNEQQIDFIRLASPDPRYQPSPVLAKVQYSIAGEKLTKSRFYQLNDNNENPATSILLTGVKNASWKALTPESVNNFPDEATLQKVQQLQAQKKVKQNETASTNSSTNNNNQNNDAQNSNTQNGIQPTNGQQNDIDLTPYQQLPLGVELSFTYQDEQITWRFALPNAAPNSANP